MRFDPKQRSPKMTATTTTDTTTAVSCPNCSGEGKLYHGEGIRLTCRQCRGVGRILK